MKEQLNTIDEQSLVTDIVVADYRTADIFRKYEIEFCCGGRRPLSMACELMGLDTQVVKKELENATRVITLSPTLQFAGWPLDFLCDYIKNVHHSYLRQALPEAKEHLQKFALGHRKKFSYLERLEDVFSQLHRTIPPHLDQEEEIIFPYIKQVDRAHHDQAPYAGLLVRTLRKPLKEIMQHEHEIVGKLLHQFRDLTDNYTLPEKACVSHRVTFHKLKEIDNDLVQHMHLENNILFPRAIAIETALLQRQNNHS
jgi:regulator of cell morphogenesis and NO signaling